jgi:CBS domain-containing protein
MTTLTKKLRQTTAADVMTREVLSVHEDLAVRELVDYLMENSISGVPVLDAEDRLVGVVTVTDIAEKGRQEADVAFEGSDPRLSLRALDEQLDFEEMRSLHLETDDRIVSDIMTRTVFTVPSDMPVPEIARELVAGRIHRIFVTNLEGRLVGVVSALDLIGLLVEEA